MSTELFHWTDEFSIGLQEIDEQHKELVDLLMSRSRKHERS